MDAILLQILNGLDKGGAYALIALGLTLIFGTLGVVNFAHGALFMLGAFCAVSFKAILSLEKITLDPTKTTAWGTPMEIRQPYIEAWLGDFGATSTGSSYPIPGRVDFDPGPGAAERTCVGNEDGFALKLDANGQFVNVQSFGGPSRDQGSVTKD